MDADAADWFANDESAVKADDNGANSGAVSNALNENIFFIPSGPPVPNPYAHILKIPSIERQFQHWARRKHLQYKYLDEYLRLYYDDCIDYMDKRLQGIVRDQPHPQEWGERVLRLYVKKGKRLSANDYKYWFTTANDPRPRYKIAHALHSKNYYHRQYKDIMC